MELRERMKKLRQKQKGFTLVELIVVIAIIGILAGVMLPRYFGFTDDARAAAVLSEAKSIRTMGETFYAKNGDWPEVDKNADFQVQTGWSDDTPPEVEYDNSPTFTGTIDVDAAGGQIVDGEFTYTRDGYVATCDPNGNITVEEE